MSLALPVRTEYDFQLRKEQMFLLTRAVVSFTSREVVRSPSESCPRLARPCTDRQWSPRIRRSQGHFLHLRAQYEGKNRDWARLVSPSQGERRNPWWLGSHRLESLVSRAKGRSIRQIGW
jgi:hypothetical protein